MIGTLLNVIAVLLGSGLGMLLGGRLSEKMRETVLRGLGLVTLVIGVQMALTTQNVLIVLGSIMAGGLLGEWLRIEEGLQGLGAWLQSRFSPKQGETDSPTGAARFIQGFVTASLVFCVGPMAILGSIQDGLTGDYRLLALKSVLDGFASLVFASSLGIGVAFSALMVFVYQGLLTLLAGQAQAVLTEAMITEMTAAGGILIIGIAVGPLLEIKPMRVGSFLPALIITPLIVWVLGLLGLPIAPRF